MNPERRKSSQRITEVPVRVWRVSLSATTMEWHCPICRKPTDSHADKEFPFCSERCRLTDLGNWASEKYKVSEPIMDESLPDSPQLSSPDDSKN